MDGYKQYVRMDVHGIIIKGFTDAFEQPQAGDIQISNEFGRHFQINLFTERGQYKYKLVNSQMIERSQVELDLEWANRTPEPPSLQQQLADMQDVINVLLGGI